MLVAPSNPWLMVPWGAPFNSAETSSYPPATLPERMSQHGAYKLFDVTLSTSPEWGTMLLHQFYYDRSAICAFYTLASVMLSSFF